MTQFSATCGADPELYSDAWKDQLVHRLMTLISGSIRRLQRLSPNASPRRVRARCDEARELILLQRQLETLLELDEKNQARRRYMSQQDDDTAWEELQRKLDARLAALKGAEEYDQDEETEN